MLARSPERGHSKTPISSPLPSSSVWMVAWRSLLPGSVCQPSGLSQEIGLPFSSEKVMDFSNSPKSLVCLATFSAEPSILKTHMVVRPRGMTAARRRTPPASSGEAGSGGAV